MPFGRAFRGSCAIALLATCATWADRPQFSEIASIEDIESEIKALVAEVNQSLISADSFQSTKGRLRLVTGQLAVFSQILAEHNQESGLKPSATAIRDAAVQFGRLTSFDEAEIELRRLNDAMMGKGGEQGRVELEWTKLARTRLLMDILRDRTDQVRKALRRPKDPQLESRQASAMAMIGIALATHRSNGAKAEDVKQWSEWSLEFQREMTQTARALRSEDRAKALEHFTAAQTVCTSCHDRFKP